MTKRTFICPACKQEFKAEYNSEYISDWDIVNKCPQKFAHSGTIFTGEY